MIVKALLSSLGVATFIELVAPEFEFDLKFNKRFVVFLGIFGATYLVLKNEK
jgi:hypothetical protein